ncbi:MAG: hypothetical protein Q4G25_02825 [Paracoccus sp. (in: a-proteobacteria)]|nr:hypothetical protein [Paracoccus sp. (in: a-proteobacteria)]
MSQLSGIGGDLFGTFAVAIGAAAVLYALMHAMRSMGRPLPRWVLPAGIAAAIIGFTTWNEYSWAERVRGQLPERVVILAEGKGRSALRPWTYLVAPVSRLAVIDPQAIRPGPEGEQVVAVVLVERWRRSVTIEQGVDCTAGRIRAPDGGAWQVAPPGDTILAAVCKGG